MQITIKPIRTWLIAADILLVTILTTKFFQNKHNYNIALGIVLGAMLGIVLTLLMKVRRVGKVFQIAVSYYWTNIILKFLGVRKSLRGKNEYYFIFAIVLLIITMIHITQIDDLKS